MQDADNLGWKLAAVLGGQIGEALLDTYAQEREFAADENILHSTRATDFITPKSEISRLFRDAVLDLSRHHAFARTLVNSGRLSVPATLRDSTLNTADSAPFEGRMQPGAAAADAPVTRAGRHPSWLLRELGEGFTALVYGDADTHHIAAQLQQAAEGLTMLRVVEVRPRETATGANTEQDLVDHDGLVAARYDMRPGTVYLLRPDQHVCARWREPSADALRAALKRALAIP